MFAMKQKKWVLKSNKILIISFLYETIEWHYLFSRWFWKSWTISIHFL